MSYCRFENTYNDLFECIKAICDYTVDEQEYSISERELEYAKKMYYACHNFIGAYEQMDKWRKNYEKLIIDKD